MRHRRQELGESLKEAPSGGRFEVVVERFIDVCDNATGESLAPVSLPATLAGIVASVCSSTGLCSGAPAAKAAVRNGCVQSDGDAC